MGRLQAMELFVGAVREGSFSAAGRRAGFSPAAVSRQIAALEASLGTQLLNRTSRSLALTEAGREYLARLEPILQDIAAAEAAASALQATPRGTLRLHSRTMFGMRMVAPLIPAFQARYPELRVELRLAEHPARLAEDDVDIDLRIGAPPEGQLMQRLLLRSERVLVASPDYLACQPAVRAPRDLLALDCLTYWVGPDDVAWRFLAEGELQELPIAARFTSNNGEVLRQLALAGHGIALLDDYTVREELAAGRLVRLLPGWRVTNSGFEVGIYAIFRQSGLLPAKIRAFLDFLVESLSRTVGGA
jgi:DNA-binding transcriptional LysR family regulator